MSKEKKYDPEIEKQELENLVSDLTKKIESIKKQQPNVITLAEYRELSETFGLKRKKFLEKQEAINELSKKRKSFVSDVLNGNIKDKKFIEAEKDRLTQLGELLEKEAETITVEMDELGKKIDFAMSESCQQYIKLNVQRQKYLDKIAAINKIKEKAEAEHQSKMLATEKKSTQFGPITITKNLFENIARSSDWQKNFLDKHQLTMSENQAEQKLQFVLKDKDIQLDVLQDKIVGSWKNETAAEGIQMMVELYLKAIENRKINNHVIEAAPTSLPKIELALATKLKEQGMETAKINNKSLEEIFSPKAVIEKLPPEPTQVLKH